MDGPKRTWKRRDVLSNPKMQVRIILLFACIALLFACTNWYVSLSSLRATSDMLQELQMTSTQRTDVGIVFQEQGGTLQIQLMLLTFSSFVLLCMAGVLLSHTIAGPMTQLSKYLKEVVEGKVAARRIRFRRHDYFWDVADQFNAFQATFGVLSAQDDRADGEPDGDA